ncbi:unnamed protein product [Didymodactylos carnosus]|uniref:Uncharacterized protein n=1 Tax=Didymodactylos carnosus TaxID=1234261 RepID=A0A813PCX4_9BILA|nr:unnamed protein product [Didymodactylos carnosus]CAF1128929.1 unnamed protein product [Didymodactylos carnosus]CAF3532222.1 unnamed protein product [Didymodactylos carnosus]CAF3909926.1 unnamed protein product [Didymodactylos carnosus]
MDDIKGIENVFDESDSSLIDDDDSFYSNSMVKHVVSNKLELFSNEIIEKFETLYPQYNQQQQQQQNTNGAKVIEKEIFNNLLNKGTELIYLLFIINNVKVYINRMWHNYSKKIENMLKNSKYTQYMQHNHIIVSELDYLSLVVSKMLEKWYSEIQTDITLITDR